MRSKTAFACILSVTCLCSALVLPACRQRQSKLSETIEPSPDTVADTAIQTTTSGGGLQHPRLRKRRAASSRQLRVDHDVLLTVPPLFGASRTIKVPDAPVVTLFGDTKYKISARTPRWGADSYVVYVYRRIGRADEDCEVHVCWQYVQKVQGADSARSDVARPLDATGDVLVMSWIRHLSGDPRPDTINQFSHVALAGGHEFTFTSNVKVSIEEN